MYMVTDVTLKYQFYLVGLYKGIKRKSDFFFFRPSVCLKVFSSPSLCVSFILSDASLSVYGSVRPGQTAKENKQVIHPTLSDSPQKARLSPMLAPLSM